MIFLFTAPSVGNGVNFVDLTADDDFDFQAVKTAVIGDRQAVLAQFFFRHSVLPSVYKIFR